MAGKTRFIVAGLLIVAAVAYLIVSSTGSTARYFLTIEELQAMGDEANSRNVTVSGVVLGDTITYDFSAPQVTFTVVQMPGDPKEVERAGAWRLSSTLPSVTQVPLAWRLCMTM